MKTSFTHNNIKYYTTSKDCGYNSKYDIVVWEVFNAKTKGLVLAFEEDSPYWSGHNITKNINNMSDEDAEGLLEAAYDAWRGKINKK